jgi:hypothetical protein
MMGKKSSKSRKIREHSSKKVKQSLRMTGILMMIASVFMITVPFMYRGTYNYIASNSTMPRVNDVITGGIIAGCIFSLIYCLLGLFVFRAGEEGTFITKGLCAINNLVLILAVIATVFIFLPIPDQTFSYAVQVYSSSAHIPANMIPMGILTIIDMACIVGLTGAVAVIDDICVFKKGK